MRFVVPLLTRPRAKEFSQSQAVVARGRSKFVPLTAPDWGRRPRAAGNASGLDKESTRQDCHVFYQIALKRSNRSGLVSRCAGCG